MKINSLTIDSSKSRTDLCELGIKYPTDKCPYNTVSWHKHPYTAVYNILFSNIRYNKLNIAELGVLDSNSMQCWREYFPNAKLFGFDWDQNCIEKGRNLNLYDTKYNFIDVRNRESLNKALSEYEKFDIIFEDTSHVFEDQINLCKIAHKYLNPGGILVIEDIFRYKKEEDYVKELTGVSKYYSLITFILTEHELRFSEGWNNDKLLVLYRNNKFNQILGDI